MIDFELKKHEITSLEAFHKILKDKNVADRVKCVIALGKGYSFEQIEEILLINERTARRYFNLYKQKGEDGLILLEYRGRIPKLTKEQSEELREHISNNLYSKALDIVYYIKKKYYVDFTPEGLVITLHRLGFSYKKTKVKPAKADPKKQEDFVEEYKRLKENLKEDEKIMFVDAVHPTHNVMPAYAWILIGTEKEVKSNTGRERVNINGAYSPNDNEIIVRQDETINAQSTVELFKMIEKKNPDLKTIYVILDNAKYNRSKLVKEYLLTSRIKLMFLPSYSPNLNLIERLWKFFKKNVLYNKYYEKVEDFRRAITDFFEIEVKNKTSELKSLMTENFHIANSV
jgi:transposase